MADAGVLPSVLSGRRGPHEGMTVGRLRRVLALLAVTGLLATLTPTAVLAEGDTTPPVPEAGTPGMAVSSYDKWSQVVDLALTFVDHESGVASVLISCDGGPETSYPYAGHVAFVVTDPSVGGCSLHGGRTLQVRAVNGDGAISDGYRAILELEPMFKLEYPLPAVTGQPFTVRIHYSAGYEPRPTDECRWEVRWGSIASLRDNDFDETFGGMLFEGPASKGFCDEWTFTLPWVPIPRFEFSVETPARDVRSSRWPDRNLVMAAVDGTDRRIRQSSLPMAQILPSTYTPVVGQPVTYTRYLIGGATAPASSHPHWNAFLGSGENPVVWEKWTSSSTFTITPTRTGPMFVAWYRETATDLLSAYYDPPVRRRDLTRPNTTAPVERFTAGQVGPLVPVSLTWSGTDRGWGINSYKLQQSVNGGAWTTIGLPSPKTTSIVRMVATGSTVRYRVRAKDKAGNVGAWDYGPTFRPRTVGELNAKIAYRGSWTLVDDATAFGGHLREATASGARATFTFRGRDIAWLAGAWARPRHREGLRRRRSPGDGRPERRGRQPAADRLPRATGRRSAPTRSASSSRATGVVGLDGFVVLK